MNQYYYNQLQILQSTRRKTKNFTEVQYKDPTNRCGIFQVRNPKNAKRKVLLLLNTIFKVISYYTILNNGGNKKTDTMFVVISDIICCLIYSISTIAFGTHLTRNKEKCIRIRSTNLSRYLSMTTVIVINTFKPIIESNEQNRLVIQLLCPSQNLL